MAEAGIDLFEANRRAVLEQAAPLSARMRPRTLQELVGHEGAAAVLRSGYALSFEDAVLEGFAR